MTGDSLKKSGECHRVEQTSLPAPTRIGHRIGVSQPARGATLADSAQRVSSAPQHVIRIAHSSAVMNLVEVDLVLEAQRMAKLINSVTSLATSVDHFVHVFKVAIEEVDD